jgi:hypothetical protein
MSVVPAELTFVKVIDNNDTNSNRNPKYVRASNISTIEKIPAGGFRLKNSDDKLIGVIKSNSSDEVLDKLKDEKVIGRVIDLTV